MNFELHETMRFFRPLLALILSLACVRDCEAFSLLGQYKSWQTADVGYAVPGSGEIGGPVLPSEGYRWNTPTVFYAYDRSFVEYFGAKGIAAVEAAIKMINDLPSGESMSADLSEYPLHTKQINYSASRLGLLDLKSTAISVILEEMGIAAAEDYVWTLRNRSVINNRTNYTVVKMNYDPVTLRPSSYVNGALYTYEVDEGTINGTPFAVASELRIADLRLPGYSSVAGGTGAGIDQVFSGEADPLTGTIFSASAGLLSGEYYLGLTRDDVGAIRRLYSKNSFAVEDVTTDTTASVSGGGPWGIPVVLTNGVAFTNNFIALRPGRGKLTFTRVSYDSLVGNVFTPFNYNYTDYYLTNNSLRSRLVTRRVTAPDLLFTAGDAGLTVTGFPFSYVRTTTTAWRSFAAINRDASFNGPGLVQDSGPGVIQGPISITFNSTYPVYFNTGDATGEADAFFLGWGSFDGSSDAPTVYPNFGEVNLELLHAFALGNQSGSQWEVVPALTILTNGTGQVTGTATGN